MLLIHSGGNKDLVIGGKANMWGEHADAGNFMGRVWSVKMHTGPTIRMWLKDIHEGGEGGYCSNPTPPPFE